MKKQQLVTDVIQQINTVLEKSRGLLSKEDTKLLEDALASLKSLENSTTQEMKSKLPMVIELLLRVLMCTEAVEQIHHLVQNL